MRIRVRSVMVMIALLAVGLSLPNPVLATTLIFTCPLWLLVFATHSHRQNHSQGDDVRHGPEGHADWDATR